MVGKSMRGRRRLQMLEDLYKKNSYEVLKRMVMHGEKAQERKCQKPAAQQTTKEEDGKSSWF